MHTLGVVVPMLDEVDHLGECSTLLSGRRTTTSPVKYVHSALAGYRSYQEHASPEPGRNLAMDWSMHALRRPISRLFAAIPSPALPVDDRAASVERARVAA